MVYDICWERICMIRYRAFVIEDLDDVVRRKVLACTSS